MGFRDFAGSTIVHSTGGWAALAGALVVGPRRGKFREGGGVKATPPSNVPVVTLGVFILWLGWFGFNGGSQLALSGAADAVAVSNILANTNLAAAAGVMAAIGLSRPVLGRVDLLAGLNGAIAGLVAITAGPDLVEHHWAVVIGAVGGAICVAGLKLMERMRIDDVVGAVPAHLFAGVWGTLAVCIAADGDLLVQIGGVLAIGAFVPGARDALMVGNRQDGWSPGLAGGRGAGPGCGGAGHRGLSGVRHHAGDGRLSAGMAAGAALGGRSGWK